MTTKLCELNSFHSNTKRKKETRSDEQNSANVSRVWSIGSIEKKNGSMSVRRNAICRMCLVSVGTVFATYADFSQPELV